MSLVAHVLSKLQTVKGIVCQMSKWPRFVEPFPGQDVQGSQALVKSP